MSRELFQAWQEEDEEVLTEKELPPQPSLHITLASLVPGQHWGCPPQLNPPQPGYPRVTEGTDQG